jgi:hypothetical protein
MAYNLSRNSRVFVTTNINVATGAVNTTGLTTLNTWEIQVMDGFKFTQDTATTKIEIKEAGSTPIRGGRSFNTALNPVDISFSTYVRPKATATTATVTAEEKVLWNALLGLVAIEGTTNGSGVTQTVSTCTATATTVTRASTSSPQITIAGITILPTLSAGQIVNVEGLTGTESWKFNKPLRVTSYTANTLIGEYLTPPPLTGTSVTSVAVSSNVKFSQSAWYTQKTETGVAGCAVVSSAHSNKNQLQKIGFIFNVDNSWYTVDDAAMDQVQLDFGLDAIATLAWSAKGTKLNNITTPVTVTGSTALTGGLTGSVVGKDTTAGYITNKLSTVTLRSSLGGVGSAATAYNIVLTGGSFTIANGITYVTPSNLGAVNIPIGYFTGSRAISGTMNAYLRTGTGEAADLLNSMLTNIATAAETKYSLQIEVGGSTNGTRIELEMPGVVIGVPSVDIADVISTAITFNAQGTEKDLIGYTDENQTYDLENTNDLMVRYYSIV